MGLKKSNWPADVVLLFRRAQELGSREEYAAARHLLDQALERIPDDPQIIVARGHVMMQQGDAETARHEFARAITIAPNYVMGHALLGLALIQQGHVDDARASLQQALALKPGHKPATSILAELEEVLGNIRAGGPNDVGYAFLLEQAEQLLARRLVKPGMTVFDVGANLGDYSILLSKLVGDSGTVYVFEPTSGIFEKLTARLQTYNCANVRLFQQAVFSKEGPIEFNEFPESQSVWNSVGVPKIEKPGSEEYFAPVKTEIVAATALDSFCRQHNVDTIDYLKIDVEGAERDVLQGAATLLNRRAIRFVQFEISQNMLAGMQRRAHDIFELLGRYGYECHRIQPDGTIGRQVDNSDSFYENYIAFSESPIDRIIQPEIYQDEFYDLIQKLCRTEKLRTVLEIGSSAGGGSTEAFVTGLRDNPANPALFCMEISRTRFQALRQRYAGDDFVKCYNVSSVGLDKFSPEEAVSAFYNERQTNLNHYSLQQVLGWLAQDIDYLKNSGVPGDGIERIKRENGVTRFDMVLIDGSEFTGQAELEAVVGATFILLDDINTYKNYENYQRLSRNPNYSLIARNWTVRNGYAAFKRSEGNDALPIHFFTLALNGEPFIRHHIKVLKHLPFKWHWHIVEGVANLTHDTAWAVKLGGKITGQLHRNGLSNDGTSEYLDELARQFPQNLTIYRKPGGEFWDGKLEMVAAPQANIQEECLLWEIDADELWLPEQIKTLRTMFQQEPQRTAAWFHCHFFVGPNLVTITPEAWSHHAVQDWLRVWRYKPGMRWASHEPPRLGEFMDGQWFDVARLNPFTHIETEARGLIFTHYAYALKSQVAFKETYYGYQGAVAQWQRLQRAQEFPVLLRDYLAWVGDNTQADRVGRAVIGAQVPPVPWDFSTAPAPAAAELKSASNLPALQIVIDGLVFQDKPHRHLGISRIWKHLIPELVKQLPHCSIILLKRQGTSISFAGVTEVAVPAYQPGAEAVLDADDAMLGQVCAELNADLFLSTYFSRASGIPNLLLVYDMIPEVMNWNLSSPMWVAKQRAISTARKLLSISKSTRDDVGRIHQIPAAQVTVAYPGISTEFYPVGWWEIAPFARQNNIQHPYFLLAGSRGGYKNSALLFEAFSQLPQRDRLQIFAFGEKTHLFPEEMKFAHGINYSSVEWLADDELLAAYSGALALVYPSRYEGFGLPVLEALACGCPVITTRSASIPEIGGDAVLYVDPDSPVELVSAMRRVMNPEVRAAMAARGLERARKFTWETMAQQFVRLLQREQKRVAAATSRETLPSKSAGILKQAQTAQDAGHWPQAIELYLTVLEKSPGVAGGEIWNRLGSCYLQAGQLPEAEAAFLGGLEFDPENPELQRNLAALYFEQNQVEKASAWLQRALQRDPNNVDLLLLLGKCAVQLERVGEALAAFQQVKRVSPQTAGLDELIRQLQLEK